MIVSISMAVRVTSRWPLKADGIAGRSQTARLGLTLGIERRSLARIGSTAARRANRPAFEAQEVLMTALRVLRHAFALATVVSLAAPALVFAQEPIDQPSEFAALRERFEGMTRAEWEAAGYRVIPPGDCIASPAGGMGIHAVNPELHEAQFQPAELDPENPPLILLDAAATRVIGLEWEEADVGQEPPTIFGQTVPLLPGHPGIPEPHYMFHAYFRPNDQVLFAEFDPLVTCPRMPGTSTIPTDERELGSISLPGLGLVGAAIIVSLLALSRRRTE
jgi:hypothetical protein